MAGSINKVTLIGNLGQDPEIRDFANGGKVCNLSIATSETWKDRTSGERRERTEWHRVAIFNTAIADNVARYLKKGAKVFIEGKLETRKWTDQDGKDRYTTEVTVRPYGGEVVFLDSAGARGAQGQDSAAQQSRAAAPMAQDIDDEIPF